VSDHASKLNRTELNVPTPLLPTAYRNNAERSLRIRSLEEENTFLQMEILNVRHEKSIVVEELRREKERSSRIRDNVSELAIEHDQISSIAWASAERSLNRLVARSQTSPRRSPPRHPSNHSTPFSPFLLSFIIITPNLLSPFFILYQQPRTIIRPSQRKEQSEQS
jgi:hypothetical protein